MEYQPSRKHTPSRQGREGLQRSCTPRLVVGACYPPGHTRPPVSTIIEAICAGLRQAREALDEVENAVIDLVDRAPPPPPPRVH